MSGIGRSAIVLGCIADDFTGASDLANHLVRAGMRVVQTLRVPTGPLDADVDAVVVALKSRTVPASESVLSDEHTYELQSLTNLVYRL